MPINPLFESNFNTQEQDLFEDLVVESIQMFGMDVQYCPRTIHNRDSVLREPETVSFDSAITIEMLLKSLGGYEGDGKIFKNLGLEINDEMIWTVSAKTFQNLVGSKSGLTRPNEGDVIYFPLAKKCFEITFVKQEATFYQLGKIYFWDITCNLFTYNGEEFKTGIPVIDDTYNALSTDMRDYNIEDTETADILDIFNVGITEAEYEIETIDKGAQNNDLQSKNNTVEDKTEKDRFGWN